jgi:hypothetical protein
MTGTPLVEIIDTRDGSVAQSFDSNEVLLARIKGDLDQLDVAEFEDEYGIATHL